MIYHQFVTIRTLKQSYFFKENPWYMSYFSGGQMRGSSQLDQKHIA